METFIPVKGERNMNPKEKRMKRQVFKLAIVMTVIMVIFTMAGCRRDSGLSRPANELIVIQSSDAVSMDPHRSNDSHSARAWMQIYDGLVTLDPDMNVVPALAREWTLIDDYTWQFTLNQGVRFHNGDEMKASDVKFTFDRHTDPAMAAPASFMLTTVRETRVIDDYTVQIITSQPSASLIFNLTHPGMGILSERAVREAGDNYATNPVGTGPFRFVEWVRNQRVVLERYNDYFQGPPSIERVVIRIIPEGATAMAELMAGSADMVFEVSTQFADQFRPGSGMTLEHFSTFSLMYLSFDMREEPFNDVRVRRAINYAIDNQALITMAWSGFGQQLRGPLPPFVNGVNDTLTGYPFDLERARALMAEAGHSNGFSSTLFISDSDIHGRIGTVLQAQLREIGINLTLQILEWGAFLERTAQGVPMFVLSWFTVTADADNGMYALFHSNSHGSRGNRSFYTNNEVDRLLDAGRAEFNVPVRMNMYQRAQEIILDEAPWGFLAATEYLVGRSNRVRGFVPMPTTFFKFYGYSLE